MGAYGSPELHPKILEQETEEKNAVRWKKSKRNRFTCPHCGKDIYFESKLTPLKIVQYSLAAIVVVFSLCICAILVLSIWAVG